MNRRNGLVAAAAIAAVALMVFVASSDPVSMWHEPTTESQRGQPETNEDDPETRAQPEGREPAPPSEALAGSWLDELFRAVLFSAIVGGAAFFIVLLLRRRRSTVGLGPILGHAPQEPVPDVHGVLIEAGAESADALAAGTPRNAIVACWVRLQDAVAECGLRRDPSETSVELTQRVLGAYLVDADAITSLAALYREARFSTHDLDESHRLLAVDALGELNRQLQHPAPASAAAP